MYIRRLQRFYPTFCPPCRNLFSLVFLLIRQPFLLQSAEARWLGEKSGSAATCGIKQSCIEEIFDTRLLVELEGVEPSSKRGNNTLSTRLVIGEIFEYMQDRDNQHIPYPLKFRRSIEACCN